MPSMASTSGQSEDEAAARGRVVSLEVENFKSYRGRQLIGPFHSFTAIIGPNGSGKSNLMDAISFVLGVRTQQLRGSTQELLYTNSEGSGSEDHPTKGHVKMLLDDGNGNEVHFGRVIHPDSAGKVISAYQVNGRTVTRGAYIKNLKAFNILVDARNFLVFQGDIESVAAMQPKDLTKLLETISGSGAFKEEYDRREAEKTEAEQKSSVLFAKKKTIVAERKQKKEQKEEAEKHLELQQELEQLKAQYYLWQLFHMDQDLAAERRLAATRKAEMLEAGQALKAMEEKLNATKKRAATHNKERLLLERKIAKRRADADKKNPQTAKVREEINRLAKRVKKSEKELEGKRKESAEQEARIRKLQEDEQKIAAAQKEAETQARGAPGELRLDQATQAEFFKISEVAGSRTAKARADRESLLRQQRMDEDIFKTNADALASLDTRLAQLRSQDEGAEARAQSLRAQLAETKEELAAKKAVLTKLGNNNRQQGVRREWLANKVDELEQQLGEAKRDRKETRRDEEVAAALAKLKRMSPGVFGRISDLGKVTQRRFNLAMAVVMGKELDSVVVESNRVAQDCIAFLHQQRLPRMTFIPLDTIRAKPANERLRQLGGTARLAIDLITFNDRLERAFQYACGGALVCDNVEEAKDIAYNRNERHKVASLDGTLFNKAGYITGGTTSNMASRAARWEDSALAALKQERAKYAEELEAMPSAREAKDAEAQAAVEVAGLEQKVNLMQAELHEVQGGVGKAGGEAATLEAEVARRRPELERLQAAMAKRQERLDAALAKINEVEDRIFSEFSRKVGVDNIREHMRQQESVQEEINRQKVELSKQAARIRSQITYERKADLRPAVAALEASIHEDQEKLKELQQQADAARMAAEGIESELAAQVASVEELRQKAAAAEAQMAELKKAQSRQSAETAKARRALGEVEARIETLAGQPQDLLQTARMEQIELPMLDSAEPMETEGDEDAEVDDDVTARLDFTGLSRAHRATKGEKEREKLAGDFRANIESHAATIARLAPNLKAVEQFEAIKEKEREQAEELEAVRRAARDATAAFNDVRQQRYEIFMAAFEHISAAIDPIFKDLTRSQQHVLGGQAYLALESQDEPFLHGLKFTAMPPTKRFREMELLSGGEKTVAALALLFAIHSYRPSPFFVLDEIDAALDATNVSRVARYIREKTRPREEGGAAAFQAVVISLKDNFYSKADALVGVCREPGSGCSATFTWNLNAYPE